MKIKATLQPRTPGKKARVTAKVKRTSPSRKGYSLFVKSQSKKKNA